MAAESERHEVASLEHEGRGPWTTESRQPPGTRKGKETASLSEPPEGHTGLIA